MGDFKGVSLLPDKWGQLNDCRKDKLRHLALMLSVSKLTILWAKDIMNISNTLHNVRQKNIVRKPHKKGFLILEIRSTRRIRCFCDIMLP